MSDEQKIKDHIAELHKADKEIDDNLNKAIQESWRIREESTAELNRY